jgi:hypothetical protein
VEEKCERILPQDAPELHEDAPELGANGSQTPANARRQRARAKTRFLTLADIDGRTLAAQRARAIVAGIEADVGLDLSTAERQLAQRAGVLGAIAEDREARWIAGEQFDPVTYCTIVNAQRRVLETLGIKRQPRDVTSFGDLLRADRAVTS